MPLLERIRSALKRRSPEPICDECLSAELKAEEQEVRRAAESNALGGAYTRELGICPVCTQEAMLNRWR